ncbi:MAG: response regulator transcription factor [Colwellia sp.]|nr:response regulator transcription factor [Colwellia sp.]
MSVPLLRDWSIYRPSLSYMKRLLIVDENSNFRQVLKITIADERISIDGECTGGDEVLDYLCQEQVDAILMDINMKRIGGIEATKLTKEHHPSIKVIALTMNDEDIFKRKMKEAGAAYYLLKNSMEKLEQMVCSS